MGGVDAFLAAYRSLRQAQSEIAKFSALEEGSTVGGVTLRVDSRGNLMVGSGSVPKEDVSKLIALLLLWYGESPETAKPSMKYVPDPPDGPVKGDGTKFAVEELRVVGVARGTWLEELVKQCDGDLHRVVGSALWIGAARNWSDLAGIDTSKCAEFVRATDKAVFARDGRVPPGVQIR